ncbi:MAG: phosphate transport system regulatory protein PhoU, partial [Firmicutes bacterium]|nr:phosphate transport system regulatory protein PhoU [Bacillota bacterium]
DMERIGDQAEDIAEIIITAHISEPEDTFHIRAMADAAMKMVSDSIDAFVEKDVELAKKVVDYDDVVDGYFDEVKGMLINKFSDRDANGEYTLDLLMIAKYFERIGDHAVNIAEWVIFSITGQREGAE